MFYTILHVYSRKHLEGVQTPQLWRNSEHGILPQADSSPEAFQNAWSHSQATRIVISIEEQKEQLSLSISDNGIGLFSDGEFPLQANHHGRGIANMFYRARLIGAHLKIESPEQGGTCIKCQIDNT